MVLQSTITESVNYLLTIGRPIVVVVVFAALVRELLDR